jgi:hypothetical protein
MSLNLHATVRAAIQSVNADIAATYIASLGYDVNASGKQVPQYASPAVVQIQSQPPAGKDLKHIEFLNLQGTVRTVYLYSNPHAIVRVDAKGGDLLIFPSFVGGPSYTWLVKEVAERWSVGQNALVTFQGTGTLTADSTALEITGVDLGQLNVGDVIGDSALALPPNAQIVTSGGGGVGTYALNYEALASAAGDTIIVTDTEGDSGWSKLYVVQQTDTPQ